jgi:Flp pilus assembly protein TadG
MTDLWLLPRLRHRPADDEGSYSVEFAIAAALVLVALLLVAVAYQTSRSSAAVTAAAREAARAASLAPTAADAEAAADQTVRARITPGAGPCADVSITTTTTSFRTAGTVSVAVTCRTASLLGHRRILRASADEVIDRYRGGL